MDLGDSVINFFAKNSLIFLYLGLIFLLEKDQIKAYLPKSKKL